jgi:hypothetical protein
MAIFQNYSGLEILGNFKTVLRAILLTQGDFVEKAALPTEFFQNEESNY